MKNVLVTGCCGFIGSNLCEELVERGYNVVGIDNMMNGKRENVSHLLDSDANFKLVVGDIRNYSLIEKIIVENQINGVSHQAALGSVPKSIDDPILANDININGSLNLLWASKRAGVKRFVGAISSAVYGNGPNLPKVEDMRCETLSPYGVTKATKEMYSKLFFDLYGLETVSLRYFNVYGKRQDPNGDYAAVIPKWILSALRGDDLVVNGEKRITRDFVYVDDVVDANILALSTDNLKVYGNTFNIGSSNKTIVQDLARKVVEKTGSSSRIVVGQQRPGDILDSYADISRAREYLRFEPSVSLEMGLDKTIEWFRNNS